MIHVGPFDRRYSGSDIYLLAKESAMRPLRRLMGRLEALELAPGAPASAPKGTDPLTSPESMLEQVSMPDVEEALKARFHPALGCPWRMHPS